MKKKAIIGLSVVVVLIVIILMNVKFKGNEIYVKAEKVKKGTIKAIVSAPGRVTPKNKVNISSDIMGKLIKLNVKEGDKVKAGQILAELERSREEAAMESARSALKSAEANYNMKKSNFERRKTLYSKSLISKETFEADKTDLEMAKLAVEERKANLKQALENLYKTEIRSPIDGVVTKLNVEEGETVVTGTMNNPGTVLMTISDLSKMQVECDVDESDVVNIEIGQPAEITVDAIEDTIFNGKVVEVSNSGKTLYSGTQEEVTNFEIKVAFNKTDKRLRPGMSSTVDIITASKDSALKVPIQAVVEREIDNDKKTGVFIIKDGEAHFTPVETGIASETEMEITKGLKGTELVVTGSYSVLSTLKDGDNVKTKKPTKKEEKREREKK
ncbi:MAG: hypothetical protein B5M53_08435 [Candidatus Cloacimonas sp. 4484_209]|nr:MAG: hypothetical protein B5M53_08435 [Candidatus Cloacimonas sp. 4484_209]